jgi:hypothetical protein
MYSYIVITKMYTGDAGNARNAGDAGDAGSGWL